MTNDSIIVAGIMALGQIGAIKILFDRTISKIDANEVTTNSHSVLLARTAEILEGLQDKVDQGAECQRELFDSRNKHGENLAQVNTLHRLKRCEELIQRNHQE